MTLVGKAAAPARIRSYFIIRRTCISRSFFSWITLVAVFAIPRLNTNAGFRTEESLSQYPADVRTTPDNTSRETSENLDP